MSLITYLICDCHHNSLDLQSKKNWYAGEKKTKIPGRDSKLF